MTGKNVVPGGGQLAAKYPYRPWAPDHGDLDSYFIAGPRVDQVVRPDEARNEAINLFASLRDRVGRMRTSAQRFGVTWMRRGARLSVVFVPRNTPHRSVPAGCAEPHHHQLSSRVGWARAAH
jgi:hypothetical protein